MVATDHQEPEELVHPRQHRQLLGRQGVGSLPLEKGGHVLLDLGPVLLEYAPVFHLLRIQTGRHLLGLRPNLRIESVRKGVCRIGAHHQHLLAGAGRLERRRRRDARLPNTSLPGVEDGPQATVSCPVGSGTYVTAMSSASTTTSPT